MHQEVTKSCRIYPKQSGDTGTHRNPTPGMKFHVRHFSREKWKFLRAPHSFTFTATGWDKHSLRLAFPYPFPHADIEYCIQITVLICGTEDSVCSWRICISYVKVTHWAKKKRWVLSLEFLFLHAGATRCRAGTFHNTVLGPSASRHSCTLKITFLSVTYRVKCVITEDLPQKGGKCSLCRAHHHSQQKQLQLPALAGTRAEAVLARQRVSLEFLV